MVSFKFKTGFFNSRAEASKKLMEVYKQKNKVQEKETSTFTNDSSNQGCKRKIKKLRLDCVQD